jgi:hypothetical protein
VFREANVATNTVASNEKVGLLGALMLTGCGLQVIVA